MSAPIRLRDPATGEPLSRLRTWLAIFVMLSGTTFVALVVTAVSPIMQTLSEHFGADGHGRLVAYAVAVVPSIGIMLGGPVTGWVIGQVGARPFALTALLVFGFAGSAGLYIDSAWALVATRFILGLSAAGVVTGTLIMIGDYFDADARARMLGYQAAIGAVTAFSIIVGSGRLAEVAGWRAPFALYLFAFLVFAAAAIGIPARPAAGDARRSAAGSGFWAALAHVWLPLLFITALFAGSFMPTLQASFLLKENGVANTFNQSLVIGLGAAMVAVGSYTYGSLRRHLADRAMLALCGALIGTGTVVMGLSHEATMVAAGCAISGLGTGLLNPQANNLLMTRAGVARGAAVGLGYTARYGGNFLNPVVVAPMAGAFGLHGAMLLFGAVFLAAAVLDATLRRLTPVSA